jgi:choline kinase
MKVIILAAGEAKRLRPLTQETPKCLLLVGGKPIIDYQIDNLRLFGLKDIIVVTGFMAQKLESHLTTTFTDVNWTFIRNENYQTTYPAYGLWMAKEHLNQTIIYLNGDVICHPEIIGTILSSGHESVTAIQQTGWDEEEVNVTIHKDSTEILDISKHISKEMSDGEFIGVTKIGKTFAIELEKTLGEFVANGEFQKFAADSINKTIQKGFQMFVCDVTHLPAIEIDTPEDLERAREKISSIY